VSREISNLSGIPILTNTTTPKCVFQDTDVGVDNCWLQVFSCGYYRKPTFLKVNCIYEKHSYEDLLINSVFFLKKILFIYLRERERGEEEEEQRERNTQTPH